jgi:pyruvate-formate lyase-activating enzyme
VSRAGEDIDAETLASRMLELAEFIDGEEGGYTISGGEPLAQPDFLFELIERLKPRHVAIETSGYASPEIFREAVGFADLIILDLKHMDSAAHLRGTGRPNEAIQRNLEEIISSGIAFWARIPLIPGYNDGQDNLRATAKKLARAAGASAPQRFDLRDAEWLGLAEPASPSRGDQEVFLVAHAAETPVGFDSVPSDKVTEAALGPPAIDEFGDEVDARLDRHYKARLKRTDETQGLEAEFLAPRRAVVADVVFAQVFHVVGIEAHHVARAAGEEEGMGTGGDRVIGVALHEAELAEASGDGAAGCAMRVDEWQSRSKLRDGGLVGAEADRVDFALPFGEGGSDGEAAR